MYASNKSQVISHSSVGGERDGKSTVLHTQVGKSTHLGMYMVSDGRTIFSRYRTEEWFPVVFQEACIEQQWQPHYTWDFSSPTPGRLPQVSD